MNEEQMKQSNESENQKVQEVGQAQEVEQVTENVDANGTEEQVAVQDKTVQGKQENTSQEAIPVQKNKKKSSVGKFIFILLLLTIIVVGGAYFWYISSIMAVNKNNVETKIVEIKTGSVTSQIASTLKQNNLIKNDSAFKIYCKLNEIGNLQAGIYEFDTSMSVEQIIKKLENGEVSKRDATIMFPEGRNMRKVAKLIADNTKHNYEDVMAIFEDKEYAEKLIPEYWFLTEDILDKDIYYPLEGYLFPDTYTFESAETSIEDIITKMLKQTDKILTKYREQIEAKNYTVHQFLSLASIVENEGMSTADRQGIAGVFLNRIARGMALQSDVTTYYAFKVEMGERDLKLSEINTYNKYNTRGPNMGGVIPVGPISNVSESSIKATLEPTNTDALFFVADKNGKVYFSKTNEEHEQTINRLKQQNLWFKYE